MKQLLIQWYHKSAFGHWLLSPGKRLYNFYRYRMIPENIFLRREFIRTQGYELNLENPSTLNEKIQWLKLNDRTPLHTLCADKYAVRDHIKKRIGDQYLIPLHFMTKDPSDIVPENLPDTPCVVKTNHNSGGVVIVWDKSKIDWEQVRQQLADDLKKNYFFRTKEWQYKNIEPCILVEKLLVENQPNLPYDYKFHCFNGKVILAQVDIDRHGDHRRNLYDRQWNLLDYRWHKDNGQSIDRPKRLEDIIVLAETLAEDFLYVRADFYSLGQDVYFGEMTFHPAAGYERFHPQQKDRELGSLLDLKK